MYLSCYSLCLRNKYIDKITYIYTPNLSWDIINLQMDTMDIIWILMAPSSKWGYGNIHHRQSIGMYFLVLVHMEIFSELSTGCFALLLDLGLHKECPTRFFFILEGAAVTHALDLLWRLPWLLKPVQNELPRITCGATPVDLSATSIAAGSFWSTSLGGGTPTHWHRRTLWATDGLNIWHIWAGLLFTNLPCTVRCTE